MADFATTDFQPNDNVEALSSDKSAVRLALTDCCVGDEDDVCGECDLIIEYDVIKYEYL